VKQQEIQLLIFSLGNSRYGIDIDQVAYLMNVDATESAISFEQLMAVGSLAECKYSKILVIKHRMGIPILIQEPDEVVTFSVWDICSLPEVLTVSAANKGVWGLLPQEQGIIILIDFYKNQHFMQIASRIDH